MKERPANDENQNEAKARCVEEAIGRLELAIVECRKYLAKLREPTRIS